MFAGCSGSDLVIALLPGDYPVGSVAVHDRESTGTFCARTPSTWLGIPLPAKGVRTSNHGRSMDRRDVWVGLKPIERLRTSRGRRCEKFTKANKTTPRSARRSVVENSLTGPTLLEMCGVEVWRGGLGGAYLLPTLSSVGASLAPPCFRFHTPLIEPDVRVCRIRLSEKTHAIAIALHVTPSATSENNLGVFRLIANLPFCRRFLRLPSTEAPSLHRSYPASSVLRASPPSQSARPFSRELPVDPHRDHRWDFPCCVWSPLPACRRQYPGRSDGILFARTIPLASAFPETGAGRLLH